MLRVVLIASLLVPVAAGSARARDLPRAKDAPHPTGCEGYGPGFVKVEGTDTCVKVSGELRAEVKVGR